MPIFFILPFFVGRIILWEIAVSLRVIALSVFQEFTFFLLSREVFQTWWSSVCVKFDSECPHEITIILSRCSKPPFISSWRIYGILVPIIISSAILLTIKDVFMLWPQYKFKLLISDYIKARILILWSSTNHKTYEIQPCRT